MTATATGAARAHTGVAARPPEQQRDGSRVMRGFLLALIVLGAACRFGFVFWQAPWTAHHPDEHILSLEAVALWEGITPREVGWPASTVRLALSGVHGVQMLADRRAALLAARSHPPAVL